MPQVGLFGAPGGGKSTVFAALTRQSSAPQFLGLDLKPTHAMAKIADPRLDRLVELVEPRSVVHATCEFVDRPGFDPASTEQKLKTAVLEHYRRCDALAFVVGLFDDALRELDPTGAETLKQTRSVLEELVLADLVAVENAAARVEKQAKHKTDKEAEAKYALLMRLKTGLEAGQPLRRAEMDKEEQKLLRDMALLSSKPLVAVLNVAEDDYSRPDADVPGLAALLKLCEEEGIPALRMSARIEADLAAMEDSEAAEFMQEYGISEPALHRFVRSAFDAMGLFTFFTAGEQEVRSWPLRKGSNAQQAAGVIHSDLARGFIRAETAAYSDFVAGGGWSGAKANGKVRLEGKEYLVADGDVLLIRFNV
jgi:GTP-binding protein YchF